MSRPRVPEARTHRKSFALPARLSYGALILKENRNGLVVDALVKQAYGSGEREVAFEMLARIPGERVTRGADIPYETRGFVELLRALGVTPHVAQNTKLLGGSVIDARTTRHPGHTISQVIRKRIEEAFGWGKTVGPIRKTKFRGLARVVFQFTLTMAGYNLIRMRSLAAIAQ